MRKFLLLLLILFSSATIQSQTYKIHGSVKDAFSGLNLSYANIRVNKSTIGTISNSNGDYILKAKEGSYSFIASFIGYKSDTVKVNVNSNKLINFVLEPIELEISEVTIEPGINPAYDIIKKTIKSKKETLNKINNYKYSAYTKGLIKTTRDFSSGSFSLSTQDTGKLKITGILENESRGFYKKPDKNKHFIVGRKQSANTPPFINILTGGNVIQSFYEDNLTFMGKKIPSPISDQALSYYYYYIEKEIALDNKKVYQIFFNTDNLAAPGFYGKLFIEDSTFHLLKLEVNLNQMANPGGLFNYVKVFQQFSVFENDIALPIDYRLLVDGNYLGLAKFGFELHTIMNSYEINTKIDEELFEGAIISVLPGADKKDQNYWNSIKAIPNTMQEEIAYNRIDSLSRVAKTFGQDFSLLAPSLQVNKNFSITGPLTLYSFNKIQGHTLNLELFFNDAETQRLTFDVGASYGFADKFVKKYLSAEYLLGEYRTTKFELNLYDRVSSLFSSSDNYNSFTSTFLSLFTKYDFRDYFYSKGFEFNTSTDILPELNLGIGIVTRKDYSANNNSNFSIFYPNKNYSNNKQIYNANINAVNVSFKIDFRKYLEDGFFRRKIYSQNNIQFEGSATISKTDLLTSDLDFSVYKIGAFGSFITVGNWSLDFSANQVYSTGTVPLQWQYALPGNISAAGKNNSFRTLKIGEVFGDNVTTLFLRHNFNDDLFRLSNIPILSSLQLQLSTHLNVALSDISNRSKEILPVNYISFTKPFYELGFSISHPLIPISFEFTWKLNYLNKNNFMFGINTIAL